jgi:hypothetical protein
MNCMEHLSRIDKNIKLLLYKLSRVVTTFSEYHITLIPNATVNIDLIESTPIYCKIDTNFKVPPLKILIEHQDASQATGGQSLMKRRRQQLQPTVLRPDWKIFVSDKSLEPNEVTSQYIFNNQSKLTIEPRGVIKRTDGSHSGGMSEFPGEYLYFNFFSLRGCSVKVTAKFPKDDEENENKGNRRSRPSKGNQLKKMQVQMREEIQARIKDISENPTGLIELNFELARLKEKQKQRLYGYMTQNNFLQENMLTLDRWGNREEDLKARV